MSGPAPTYRPTFTPEEVLACQRLVRQQHAPHVHVVRAKLVLLLHAQPCLDSVTAAHHLGRHPNWVYVWRKRWATGGFALTDQPGRGRKPAFSPSAGRDRQGAGLCTADAARRTAEPVQHDRPDAADRGAPRRAAAAPQHHLAPPGYRRAQALAAPGLALPARPAVRGAGRACAGPVPRRVGGAAFVA